MLKLNYGWAECRQATLIGFGLTESNLKRLSDRADPDPVIIRSSDIGIDAHFCIFYAGIQSCQDPNVQCFQAWFDLAFKKLKRLHVKEPEGKLPVINMYDSHIFVVPLFTAQLGQLGQLGQHNSETPLYAIGLTDRAMQNMRNGQHISYRLRVADQDDLLSSPQSNYELTIFWGQVLENLESQFMRMIGPRTQVRIP